MKKYLKNLKYRQMEPGLSLRSAFAKQIYNFSGDEVCMNSISNGEGFYIQKISPYDVGRKGLIFIEFFVCF